jgi:hypothetical protein
MKKLILGCIVFLTTVSTSFAFDFMGPATNPWQAGQWGFAFAHSYTNMHVDVKGNSYINHAGISADAPRRLKIHKYYGIFGRGLTDNIGVYGIAGAASARADISVGGPPYAHRKMDFGHAPVLGFGVKSTLYRNHKVQVGAMAQATWVRGLHAKRHIYSFQSARANISLMEMQLALAATYQCCARMMIYGGPFLHFIRGDFGGMGRCSICGVTDGVTHDIQQASWFGGYVGAQIRLYRCMLFTIEFMHTARGSGVGTSIAIPLS